MKVRTSGLNSNFLPIVISLAYSLFLCYSDLIFGYSFDAVKDRINYQAYIGSGLQSLNTINGLNFLFLEPLFLVVMAGLSILFDSSNAAVRALIAGSSFLFAYSLLKIDRVSLGVKVLILLFPWILVNYIMTLRQGLALSAFMYAYFHSGRYAKLIIYSILPLIHYLFWIVLAFILAGYLVRKIKISAGVFWLFSVLFVVFTLLGLLLSLYNSELLGGGELYKLLNAYRDEVSFQVGFGWFFWAFVLFIFGSQRRSLILENYLPFLFILLYLIFSPFFAPVSRIMQVGAPFVLIGALDKSGLKGYHKIVLIWATMLHILYFIAISLKSGGPGGMV